MQCLAVVCQMCALAQMRNMLRDLLRLSAMQLLLLSYVHGCIEATAENVAAALPAL